ncbi:hypothetical protein [Siphonobacter sp. SORGH_AS_1065]|uniref:hypothetical protein n=1 Tax=Siphonobacter sp. SORGH_AS_1065 TaxID=3041795 RepID=UPI0027893561|nr:hypothetical protein [Siphonobacter sp. SORGH_AS_1065]MDQ1090435.1 hypothetical protein [Siphonobacter sp. SORGH_AS_1065]
MKPRFVKFLFAPLVLISTLAAGQYPLSAQYMWNTGLVREKGSEGEIYRYFVMEIHSDATFELRVCMVPKGSTRVAYDPLAAGSVLAKGDTLLLTDTLGIKPGAYFNVLSQKKMAFVQGKESGRIITSDPLLAGNHFYQTMYFYPEGQKWKYGGRDPEGRKHNWWAIYARDGTPIHWTQYDHGVILKEK